MFLKLAESDILEEPQAVIFSSNCFRQESKETDRTLKEP
ncbi:hypothetical protein Mal35_17640 [Gimesia maris]|nr:hypothetical protein Mal35_17640 [Gimesia maris]